MRRNCLVNHIFLNIAKRRNTILKTKFFLEKYHRSSSEMINPENISLSFNFQYITKEKRKIQLVILIFSHHIQRVQTCLHNTMS